MANKRTFKKYVEAIGASICDEMMIAYYNVDGIDQNKVQNALGKVLGAVGVATSNANVFFDKGVKAFETRKDYETAKRNFFKKLFQKISTDFSATVDEALKEFNAAIPAGEKEKMKASAN